jgi:hypothetical protein
MQLHSGTTVWMSLRHHKKRVATDWVKAEAAAIAAKRAISLNMLQFPKQLDDAGISPSPAGAYVVVHVTQNWRTSDLALYQLLS